MKYLEKTLFSKVKENILRGRKKDALLKEEYTNSKIKTLIIVKGIRNHFSYIKQKKKNRNCHFYSTILKLD